MKSILYNLFILSAFILFFTCGNAAKSRHGVAKKIPIEWINHLSGDFSFVEKWNYTEGIYRNSFGQLVCDGFCPSGSDEMIDENGQIKPDSLTAYYQLVDTSHYYYNAVISEQNADSLWYIEMEKIGDTLRYRALCSAGYYGNFVLDIVGNEFMANFIENFPNDDPSEALYPCVGGFLKIDETFWNKNILKAVYQFKFYDTFNRKEFIRTGKILINKSYYNE